MKKAHVEHKGMKIELLDGSFGTVQRVTEHGYAITRKDGSKLILSIEEIRWSKSGKLYQLPAPVEDLTGLICQLTNFNPNINGVVVKVEHKRESIYRFSFSTGAGGEALQENLIPITKHSVLDRSWSSLGIVDDSSILCSCCGQVFEHEDLVLYYIPLKEWHKQGVLCKTCSKSVSPLLSIIKARPDEEQIVRAPKKFSTFSIPELVELNDLVKTDAEGFAVRHGLTVTESHSQLRPTAMEYTLTLALPTDVIPEPPVIQPTKTVVKKKRDSEMEKRLKDKPVESRSEKEKDGGFAELADFIITGKPKKSTLTGLDAAKIVAKTSSKLKAIQGKKDGKK